MQFGESSIWPYIDDTQINIPLAKDGKYISLNVYNLSIGS
jgi:hypothetical protein